MYYFKTPFLVKYAGLSNVIDTETQSATLAIHEELCFAIKVFYHLYLIRSYITSSYMLEKNLLSYILIFVPNLMPLL